MKRIFDNEYWLTKYIKSDILNIKYLLKNKQMIKRLTGVMVLIFVLQSTKFNVQASNISCLENEKISCTDDIPNLVNDY